MNRRGQNITSKPLSLLEMSRRMDERRARLNDLAEQQTESNSTVRPKPPHRLPPLPENVARKAQNMRKAILHMSASRASFEEKEKMQSEQEKASHQFLHELHSRNHGHEELLAERRRNANDSSITSCSVRHDGTSDEIKDYSHSKN